MSGWDRQLETRDGASGDEKGGGEMAGWCSASVSSSQTSCSSSCSSSETSGSPPCSFSEISCSSCGTSGSSPYFSAKTSDSSSPSPASPSAAGGRTPIPPRIATRTTSCSCCYCATRAISCLDRKAAGGPCAAGSSRTPRLTSPLNHFTLRYWVASSRWVGWGWKTRRVAESSRYCCVAQNTLDLSAQRRPWWRRSSRSVVKMYLKRLSVPHP